MSNIFPNLNYHKQHNSLNYNFGTPMYQDLYAK